VCLSAPKIQKPDIRPLPEPEKTAENFEVNQSAANRASSATRRGRSPLKIDLTAPKPATKPGLQIPT
jgi:hypothetical protein